MRTVWLPLGLALLAGCARDRGSYPSLAPRAAEARGFDEPAAAAAGPARADPALDARLAGLSGRLDAVAKGHDAAAAIATRAVAAPGARTTGSEGWVAAQQTLAALDDWRAQAAALATEADGLARERAEKVGTPYPALDAFVSRAQVEADREAAAVAALNEKLPQP